MYKLKYFTYDKEKRKKIKEEFYQTDFGQNLKARLNRLFIIGTMGIIFSIYLFISNLTIWDIVTASLLLIASVFFIISSFTLRIKNLNNFVIKTKKK